jgi:hypothetical protein
MLDHLSHAGTFPKEGTARPLTSCRLSADLERRAAKMDDFDMAYFQENVAKIINVRLARVAELTKFCSPAEFRCYLLGLHCARLKLLKKSGAPDLLIESERKLRHKAMAEAVRLLRQESTGKE